MKGDTKAKILAFLSEVTKPVDVEKIRTSCKIGNWNTALKHCLELLIQGKIRGEKTSKSWVFWTHQQTHLHAWDEAIGHLEALQVNDDNVVVTLTHAHRNLNITFPKNSPEAETITTLTDTPKGTKIALLKTDNPQKPLIIKTFNETTAAQNVRLALLWLRRSILCVAFKGVLVGCIEVFVVVVGIAWKDVCYRPMRRNTYTNFSTFSNINLQSGKLAKEDSLCCRLVLDSNQTPQQQRGSSAKSSPLFILSFAGG